MIQTLLVLAFTWSVICFFDCIFKTCMLFPYVTALNKSGITIKPCYIYWYITRYNRLIQKWGCYKPHLMRKWFDCGALVSSCLILPSLGLLLTSALKIIAIKEQRDFDDQLLIPVVPGINLPLSHLLYYLIIVALCSILHELGHALAASRENVHVEGCGFFLVAILPAAFVDLHKEQLMHLSSWQQLRVFSAGIWHNIVIACLAVIILQSNTMLLSPVYQKNSGISVVDVVPHSGAAGPAGLSHGDHIVSINKCLVSDINSWSACLKQMAIHPEQGYCATKEFIFTEDTASEYGSNKDCCGNSSRNVCFEYRDIKVHNQVCLPARKVIINVKTCLTSSDCSNDNQYECVAPVLLTKSDRLIEINRIGSDPVLFFGSLSELYSTVTVSPWIAKYWFLSVAWVEIYETFLKYTVAFSGALAFLNLIPCHGLDGQFLCETLVHLLLYKLVPKILHRNRIVLVIKFFGLVLIFINVVIGLYKLVTS